MRTIFALLIFVLLASSVGCSWLPSWLPWVNSKPAEQAAAKPAKAVVTEKLFIAFGKVVSMGFNEDTTGVITMIINSSQPIDGMDNFGSKYEGKEVDVLVSNGLPALIAVGDDVELKLRVDAQKHGTVLFLVEEL